MDGVWAPTAVWEPQLHCIHNDLMEQTNHWLLKNIILSQYWLKNDTSDTYVFFWCVEDLLCSRLFTGSHCCFSSPQSATVQKLQLLIQKPLFQLQVSIQFCGINNSNSISALIEENETKQRNVSERVVIRRQIWPYKATSWKMYPSCASRIVYHLFPSSRIFFYLFLNTFLHSSGEFFTKCKGC